MNSEEKRLVISCHVNRDNLKATGSESERKFISGRPDDSLYPGFRLVEESETREVIWTDGQEIFRQKETDARPNQTELLNLKDPLCTAFSQDGDWAGIDDEEGFHLYHWSDHSARYEETQVLKIPSRTYAAEWSADRNYLVLSGDEWIRVWDMRNNRWVELEEGGLEGLKVDFNVAYPRQVRKKWSSIRLGKEKPLLLVDRTDPDNLPDNAVPSLLVYDLRTGKMAARLDEASLGCLIRKEINPDQVDFAQHDTSLILNLPDRNGADELIRYSLDENKVVLRQHCPETIGRFLVSSTVQASNDNPWFALTNSGGVMVSRTGGLRTGADTVFSVDDSGFYPLAVLDTTNAYFSPDMRKMVQGFDPGFILQSVLSSEELSRLAKEFLTETEDRNRESAEGADSWSGQVRGEE